MIDATVFPLPRQNINNLICKKNTHACSYKEKSWIFIIWVCLLKEHSKVFMVDKI